jgi:signal peptidase II
MWFYTLLIIVLVALDQLTKHLARQMLTAGSYTVLIPNFIQLTYQENPGISFSLLSDLPARIRIPALSIISALVVIVLLVYLGRQWSVLSRKEKWGFSLIIAGAVGNLIDRVFRHQVTDFMFFHIFDWGLFVNNLADDLISIGFVILVIAAFTGKKAR